MYLKSVELTGFKSFGKKTQLAFGSSIVAVVGPNGSGKSNVADGFRFVLGEQSMKSMRGKKGEDMIWGGSPSLARMNRASVKLVFDNSSRLLDIDFAEVTIERVVYRDGQNEYLLNGSQVRLKDVIRLLAGANIGGSGYQIISQGEADRILNASPKERREMVEDALGLKLYQHKKAESERKLEETAANIDKTKSLRRELAPHIMFLKAQVEKLERAQSMKDELSAKLREYLAREDAWIGAEYARLIEEGRERERELRELRERLSQARANLGEGERARITELQVQLNGAEATAAALRREAAELLRDLGRAEGALEANNVTVEQIVAVPHVRGFARDIDSTLAEVERMEDPAAMRGIVMHARERIRSFIEGLTGAAPVTNHEARAQVEQLGRSLEKKRQEEERIGQDILRLRKEIALAREAGYAAERDVVDLEGRIRAAESALSASVASRASVEAARQRFEEEVREGVALLGAAIGRWHEARASTLEPEDRGEQDKRRRAIERLKIKIEESGVGDGDAVIKEFSQTKERDEFLARELTDLEASAVSLKGIIAELERTIDERFESGLEHINAALREFFVKLFGGGDASLKLEKPRLRQDVGEQDTLDGEDVDVPEEEELYAGLSISVSLPRKKVRGLEVLSGGERALTSIALIFSMSQVNPPPFLILDETDAALDEANSKRYADMIRELGKKSQLIVITHNRSTMAAAGELYGVTMGADGVSKLLSVKLEEAERVAK
jgi:chromosome segregation protein